MTAENNVSKLTNHSGSNYEIHVMSDETLEQAYVLFVRLTFPMAVKTSQIVAEMFRSFDLIGFHVLVVENANGHYNSLVVWSVNHKDVTKHTSLN